MSIKEKNKLSENLIYFRKLKKMSQIEVALKLDIPRTRYAKYENNVMPPVSILEAIAKIYGIDIDTLVRTVQHSSRPKKSEGLIIKFEDCYKPKQRPPVKRRKHDNNKLNDDEEELWKKICELPASGKRKLYMKIIEEIEGDNSNGSKR